MKKLLFLLFLLTAAGLRGFAQTDNTPPPIVVSTHSQDGDTNEVYHYAEQMPDFPGGQGAFFGYLKAEVHYPPEAKEKNHQGTVYVEFVIEKDGSISNVQVVKGVTDAPELSEEAVRVIKAMPKWKPGRMNGKPVRVIVTQPVKFVLTQGK